MPSGDFIDNSGKVLKMLDDAVERGLTKIGIAAEGHAKMKCPVDTGRLRGSIVYATSKSKSKGQFPAEPKDYTPMGTPDKHEVIIGTNVEYASPVELGTERQQAQPFLRPAAENHNAEYQRLMESELRGQ